MAISHVNHSGDWHVLLRIKGSDDDVEKFHQIMKLCDNDWGYVGRPTVRICKRCCGMIWHAPRIAPSDFKVAARQAGGVKIKIKHFASVAGCRGTNVSFDYQNDIQHLSQSEARELYRANGVANFREKHTPTVSLPGQPIVPPVGVALVPTIVTPLGVLEQEQLRMEALRQEALRMHEAHKAIVPVVTEAPSALDSPNHLIAEVLGTDAGVVPAVTDLGSLCQLPAGDHASSYDDFLDGWEGAGPVQ